MTAWRTFWAVVRRDDEGEYIDTEVERPQTAEEAEALARRLKDEPGARLALFSIVELTD
jgi:hypothetical protein